MSADLGSKLFRFFKFRNSVTVKQLAAFLKITDVEARVLVVDLMAAKCVGAPVRGRYPIDDREAVKEFGKQPDPGRPGGIAISIQIGVRWGRIPLEIALLENGTEIWRAEAKLCAGVGMLDPDQLIVPPNIRAGEFRDSRGRQPAFWVETLDGDQFWFQTEESARTFMREQGLFEIPIGNLRNIQQGVNGDTWSGPGPVRESGTDFF